MFRIRTALPLVAVLATLTPAGIALGATNLISNPDFASEIDPWWEVDSNGAIQFWKIDNGELCSMIRNPGIEPWDIVIGINGLAMEAGKQYEISFVAHAEPARSIRFKTGKGSPPYSDYFLKEVQVSTSPETIAVSFLNTVEDADTQFQFHLGGATGTVCFDDVSVKLVSSTPSQSTEPYVSPSKTGHPLREYKSVVGIGSAVDANLLVSSPEHNAILGGEFSGLTPINSMKMENLVPVRGAYSWSTADVIVDFATKNGMDVHGHALVWHVQQPDWLEVGSFGRDEMIQIMQDHISTVMGRYVGRVKYWDVVNEAIHHLGTDTKPDYSAYDYRSTIWYDRIGKDYIELAFRSARAADPAATLLYNDFGIEVQGALKSEVVYELIRDLVGRGVPIDAVGFQMHLMTNESIDFAAVRRNMERYAKLGVGVQITEMDVRIPQPASAEDFQIQAQMYRDALSACVTAPNCDYFTTWGLSDNDSWIPKWFPGFGTAHLFDAEYQPRPAYHALTEFLDTYDTASPAAEPPAKEPSPTDSSTKGSSADPGPSDDGGGGCSLSASESGARSNWMLVLAGAILANIRRRRLRS